MTTKSYRTLRKKLQELEAELHFFSTHSPEIAESHRYLLASEIQQHFHFVNNLLKAEIDSDPTNPQYLTRIARRLSKIQAAFCTMELSSPVKNFNSVHNSVSSSSSSSADDEKVRFKENMADGKGRLFVFKIVRFCGVFMSGVIFGTVLTGMGMVELSDLFISSAASEGFLIPT